MLFMYFSGTCFICPELTLPCFDTLLALGSDGLEMDINLSADDQLVIMEITFRR